MASVSFILSRMSALRLLDGLCFTGLGFACHVLLLCSTRCEFLALLGIGRLGVEMGKARTAALPMQPGGS